MRVEDYNKAKERPQIFEVSKNSAPLDIYSQNVYTGINAFTLLNQSKLHDKKPLFLTPLQVKDIGGSMIPPEEFFFNRKQVKKYFPKINDQNIHLHRKDIFSLYKKNKIEVSESPNLEENFKLNGGVFFDVFIKENSKIPIYIDSRFSLAQIQLEALSKMEYNELRNFLEEMGVPYSLKPISGIAEESQTIISNVPVSCTYPVISVDDVIGIKNDSLLYLNYLDKSNIFENNNSEAHKLVNKVITDLSKKFSVTTSGLPVKENPLEYLKDFFRLVSNHQVYEFLRESTNPILLQNSNLLSELVANKLFNSIGLYGFDDSHKGFNLLISETSTVEVFKHNHIVLQSSSHTLAKKLNTLFNSNEIKEKLNKIYKFSDLKEEIKNEFKNLEITNLYEKIRFSDKGYLTLFDFGKVNYQLHKIGKPDIFDQWLQEIFKHYNFINNSLDENSLKEFIKTLSEQDLNLVKNYVKSTYLDFKVEEYKNHTINFSDFTLKNFFSFLVQNEMKDLIPFFRETLSNSLLINNVEEIIKEENKISFSKEKNELLSKLYNDIKKEISSEKLIAFHDRSLNNNLKI